MKLLPILIMKIKHLLDCRQALIGMHYSRRASPTGGEPAVWHKF